jgi:hypothetical protein
MIKINDNGTNRDMTNAELSDYEAWAVVAREEQAARQKLLSEHESARASALGKLSDLGLSDTEIAALVG